MSEDSNIIPEHQRPLSRIMAEANGESFLPLRSLEDAKDVPDGRVILEGDYGGQIFLTCPAQLVLCTPDVLYRLLLALDSRCWPDSEGHGTGVYFERLPAGAGVWGGLGGGVILDELWLHEEIENFGIRPQIEKILSGHCDHLE